MSLRLSLLRREIVHRATVHADGISRQLFDLLLREFEIIHPGFVKRKWTLGDAFVPVAGIIYTGIASVKKFE